MKRCLILLLCAVFVLLSLPSRAQDYVYATGNPNFGVNYPIPGGYINVTNGNVHITIALGTFKQRGNLPPVKINLEYDSRIWKIIDNGGSYSWQPTNVPNSMAGWRLTTGLEEGTTSYSEYVSQTGTCGPNQTPVPTQETYTNFKWTDSSGTKHLFNAAAVQQLQLPSGCPQISPPPPPASANGYAIDGSGYYVSVVNDYQMTVYDNSGNEVYPEHLDQNGNSVSINSSGTVTDSMGRTLLTQSTGSNPIVYAVLKEGGGSNTFSVNTESVNLNTSFNQSAVSEYSGSITAIQSVTLPDGSAYSFSYDPDSYGEMTSMTLPTGGSISFSYTNYLDSYNNYNRWISTETEAASGYTTSFTPQVLSQCGSGAVGCQEQMTLVRPSGDSKVYTLTLNNGAWDGVTNTYAGSSQSSTQLMAVVNNYNFNSYPCELAEICTGSMYVTATSSKVTLTDSSSNLSAQTIYNASSPWTGKIDSKQEYDYGASTPTRETDYHYSTGVNGSSQLASETRMFNGNTFSQTAYTYDSNGNLTGKTVSAPGSSDLSTGATSVTTSYGVDSNGMRTSMTDPKGNITSYAYSCNDGYLSQTTYPATNGISHITHVTPDCSSGDPLNTTDQNGNITQYSYDNIGRKTSVQYPDGGQTSYSYPSPTQVQETKLINSSESSTKTTTWDAYGRKGEVSLSDPAGNDVVTYSYDGDNRTTCTTNPQRSGSAPTNGSTCVSYDALDRPTQVVQPDGNKIAVIYSANEATVTDENGHQKRYQYDAFHDLTAVWEPNVSGTPSWETSYSYDGAGHVTSVTQSGDGSSAARTRAFQYDFLGHLESETTPEGGTKSYIYDPNGNLYSSTAGGNTISYQYDALNRMTQKSSTGFNYSYVYDTASPGGGFTSANPIGHLIEESNNANAGSLYSYDAMGRVISEENCLPSNCWTTGTVVGAAYDLAGDLASLTYPDGRVVSESYDSALHLTGVQYASWSGQSVDTPYFSATGFAPTGETTNAVLGNGVQMTAAFNSRQSITALSYATPSQTLWSKQYTWAANAKNLLQSADMVNASLVYNYNYDPDNRLISASGGGYTPATSGSGSVTVSGAEQSAFVLPSGCRERSCGYTVYNSGSISITIGTTTQSVSYGAGSTAASLASSIAAAFDNDSSSVVNAAVSGDTVTFTAKSTGTASNYPMSESETYDSQYFSGGSFPVSASGSTLTGGASAGNYGSGPDVLNESYSIDPWGNMQESGNFNFTQPFTTSNQISGYSYDAAGNLVQDGLGNRYTYDAEGMMTSANSVNYIYDALQQRVQKTGGSNATEIVYFRGHPVALLNPSSGAWTDLIWAGKNLLAEVPGSQTGSPVYRLLDHEGTLAATTTSSGAVIATNLFTPYGQPMIAGTGDAYSYAGLFQDTEYAGDAAWYRNYTTQQARWLRPDPYNGSYDLNNPQSFNRYMYVNGNPLSFTDPSGLAGAGVLTGVGGNLCLGAGPGQPGDIFNFCDPLISAISVGLFSTSALVPYFSFAVTLGCSFAPSSDTTSSLCGQSGWTSAIFTGKNKWVGTLINDAVAYVGLADAVAIPGAVVAAGASSTFSYLTTCITGPSDPVCDVAIALIAYTALNDLFSVFWDAFGPAQFTGSLLPRPSDMGGFGTTPTGIPNQNLSIKGILGQPLHNSVPSPGMNVQ